MAANDLSGEIIVRILGLEGGPAGGVSAPRHPGASATTPGGLFMPPGVMAPPSVSGIGNNAPMISPEVKEQDEKYKKLITAEEQKQTSLLSGVMAGPLKFLAGALGIGALISQSKILGTTMSTFMQLIGTLVDIFLRPLVPLLMPLLKGLGSIVANAAKGMAEIMRSVKDVGWAETFKLVAIGAWAEIKDSFTTAWNETLDQWGTAFNKVVDFFLNPLKEFIAWVGSLFGKDWSFGGATKVPLPGGQSIDVNVPSKIDKLIDKLDRLPGLDPVTRAGFGAAQFVIELYQRGANIEEGRVRERFDVEHQSQLPPAGR